MSLVESARRIQLVAAVFAAILGLCFTSWGQTPSSPNGLAGIWKLDLLKSSFESGPPPYKRSLCKIDFLNDTLKVTYDLIGVRGGITHLEWVGKLDGKDYPIQGVEDVLTNAYTRIDERTYEVVVKADGAKAAAATIVIAPDGKTLTTVTSTRTALGQTLRSTAVYVRQ